MRTKRPPRATSISSCTKPRSKDSSGDRVLELTENPAIPVYWGSPFKREVNAVCVTRQFRWVTTSQIARPLNYAATIGNLVSVNRNSLIHQAKEAQATNPGILHFQVDSDAWPVTPLDDCLRFVREDFDSGYGLVIAPVHGVKRVAGPNGSDFGDQELCKEWTDAKDAVPGKNKPWPILGGSFTAVFFNPHFLRRLTPIESFTPVGESPIPIYCAAIGPNTEDVHLCLRAKNEFDFDVAADSRLRFRHSKEILLDGYGLLPDER